MKLGRKTIMSELRECPICKKTVAKICTHAEMEQREEDKDWYCVACNFQEGGCGASGGYRETPEEAAEAWNVRVGEEKDNE